MDMEKPQTSHAVLGRAIARHPIWFAVALTAAIVIVETAIAWAADLAAPGLPMVQSGLIANSVLALIAGVLVSYASGWRAAGFRAPISPASLLHCWAIAAYSLIVLAGAPSKEEGVSFSVLALAMIVGFQKEAFSRGLALWMLEPLGRWRAVSLCGLLYGAMHLGALFVGAPLQPTLVGATMMALIGFAYAAVRLRTATIWPLVALQALFYVGAFSQYTSAPSALPPWNVLIMSLLISVSVAGYGVVTLWFWPDSSGGAAMRAAAAQRIA